MKNILILWCCLSCSVAFAHTIHLKDGRKITAEKVWEEVQGYHVTDLTTYGCQHDGVSQSLVDDIGTFKHQLAATQELLLQRIQQKIGPNGMKTARKCLEAYIEKKSVVSYETRGATISLDRHLVEKIDYDAPPQPLHTDLLDPDDYETQQAIADEKEELYERLNYFKKAKAGRKVGSPVRASLNKDMQEVQALIDELEADPFGYFIRRKPWRIRVPKDKILTPEQCAQICGGELSSVETPTIRATSYEHGKFEACMNTCTRNYKAREQQKEQEKEEK